MKRSGFAPRTKPMPRAGLKPAATAKAPATRPKMKSRGPKMTPIRKAAQGQDCTLRIPGVCNYNPETTVLCHSPYLSSGRGMGLKAPDTEACFGCSSCHDHLDKRVPWRSWMTDFLMEGAFIRARNATHEILKKKGLLPHDFVAD
jgi:hypothetical protein